MSCQEYCVCCATGGEKRRLTIACSLVANPSILFMDEPTTGLDAFAALNIMDHMSCLAVLGHTIIASIHQPRSAIWEMFHKVLPSCRLASVFPTIDNQLEATCPCLTDNIEAYGCLKLVNMSC